MTSIIQVKVPVLPESVQDATIATWHKKPGDAVKRDENLVDLETDKVVLEVPAPADGILKEVLKSEGATVNAQELLASIDTSGSAAAPSKPQAKQEDVKAAPAAKAETKTSQPSAPKAAEQEQQKTQHYDAQAAANLSPSARRAAGQGLGDANAQHGSNSSPSKPADAPRPASTPRPSLSQAISTAHGRTEKRVPMTRLRAKIAERLVESQHTAAILTTFNEINMQPVMDIRAKYKDEFEKAHGIKLGFMSFFVKACVEALKRSPVVNASIDGNDIVYHGYFDIGVAVSSDRGLVVPIIRDADQKSMADIEAEIRDFGARAQKGQLTMEEITGGTFTVSNGGTFGSLLSTPIINPPQSGILGMHKIEERAVVENKAIVIRPMMYVAFSYDHRIIDGKESVTFLKTIKELLEDPTRLLLDV